jgi:hypothetical protein
MSLPWKERITTFIVNPESARISDISRLASDLSEARHGLNMIAQMRYKIGGKTEEVEMARKTLAKIDEV